jgi:hypothetical protein
MGELIMNTNTAAARRLAVRSGVALGAVALVAGLSACGSSGTQVYERESNGATHGVAMLQAGTYRLDLSCTDKRPTRKVNGKSKKYGSSPTVYFSTTVNGRQVKTNAYCTGSDTEKFTLTAPTNLNLDATVNGSATYRAKVYLEK